MWGTARAGGGHGGPWSQATRPCSPNTQSCRPVLGERGPRPETLGRAGTVCLWSTRCPSGSGRKQLPTGLTEPLSPTELESRGSPFRKGSGREITGVQSWRGEPAARPYSRGQPRVHQQGPSPRALHQCPRNRDNQRRGYDGFRGSRFVLRASWAQILPPGSLPRGQDPGCSRCPP